MESYQERVVEELTELCEKLSKLSEFMRSDSFIELPYHERGRLNIQFHIMKAYEQVLRTRIEDF